ncbi:MAG: histidine phosphatase family protein [Saprospiraceae bacterium]|jgi:phosphohistidine phosphatase SixA|nr:histidine phosphatase family protein [Saprospiraceae bacterium]MBL0025015.1 histidine phosphatase family protein [Saprospiraceae bacterium]
MTKYLFKGNFILILFAFLMFIFSCKQDIKIVDINGKKILSIESNIIKTEDGTQLVLEEDSIAKIYYLVRHAEKDTSVKVEPPLNADGLKRATKIADIMRGTRVDVIYSTLTLRTMFTVDSLADIKAMSIKPYENKDLKKLLTDIQQSTDFNRIFIVGHSNTIPSITNTLAGRDIFTKTFDESDYSNFVIVVEKKSGVKDVYTLKY